MAEIALEAKEFDALRFFSLLFYERNSLIFRPVIDKNNFILIWFEDRNKCFKEWLDVLLFVVDGNDYRNEEVGHEE